MPKYLQKRRRRWYAVLEIPKSIRHRFDGQRRFFQSLETESLSEAEQRVLPVVARWKAEIEAARTGSKKPVEDLMVLAMEYRRGREDDDEGGREVRDDLIDDKARDLEWSDPDAADVFYRVAKGEAVPLDRFVQEWLLGLRNEPKTKDMKRTDVMRFVERFKFSHKVEKLAVQRWTHTLQEEGYASATISRIVSACRGYWKYLNRAGHVHCEADPFEDAVQKDSTRSKSVHSNYRQPFGSHDLARLLHEAEEQSDGQMRDLIWLAMWTGCRIEEMCSFKLEQVQVDRLSVQDAKSVAGNREVPIHPRLEGMLNRLRRDSTDGYLLSGLTTNKYGDRSNAIGKRFGRLKKSLGYDSRYVFHSIRKSVATDFENQGVPENVAADILGHEKKTMTYGTYSGGSSFEVKRDALAKLSYPGLDVPDVV